jgi:hypothetical protein
MGFMAARITISGPCHTGFQSPGLFEHVKNRIPGNISS